MSGTLQSSQQYSANRLPVASIRNLLHRRIIE